MVDFSETIRGLREKKHLTQTELANELGVTKSMISAYETATRSPSYDVLVKIARFFNVSMDYLFGFNNETYINVKGLTQKEKNIIGELVGELKDNKE